MARAARDTQRVAAFGAALLLAGCLGGPAPRDHYYRLEPAAPAAALETPVFPGTLRVEPFRAGALERGTLLLYRNEEEPAEVHRSAYHHWADSPEAMLQRAAVEYLRAAGAADTVVGHELRVSADYTLYGRVVEIERRLRGGQANVHLALELSVIRSGTDTLAFQQTYREQQPGGSSMRESAEAFNRALGDILARFLADAARS